MMNIEPHTLAGIQKRHWHDEERIDRKINPQETPKLAVFANRNVQNPVLSTLSIVLLGQMFSPTWARDHTSPASYSQLANPSVGFQVLEIFSATI